MLDLAAHDGRWAYAFAGAGAARVVGIEGRGDLIARFAQFPDPELKARVRLREGDIFAGMEAALAAGERYDVVGVLGIFYHIMDHFRLLRLVQGFQPRLVIVDGDFALAKNAMIQLMRESIDNPLNAIAQIERAGTRADRHPQREGDGDDGRRAGLFLRLARLGTRARSRAAGRWPTTTASRANAAPAAFCGRASAYSNFLARNFSSQWIE